MKKKPEEGQMSIRALVGDASQRASITTFSTVTVKEK